MLIACSCRSPLARLGRAIDDGEGERRLLTCNSEQGDVMSERIDKGDAAWPLRPWIMAAICSAAALIFDLLADFSAATPVGPLRQAAAAFIVVAAVSFALTVEQRRWRWAVGFALGWGLVVALVGWFTASYNHRPEIVVFPFMSAVFAVLLAAPLFQTWRDEGAWRLPYARLHGHAWADAVIGAASLGFVAISFMLAWLLAGLFRLIGIDAVKDLLSQEWFAWMLAGFAFGSAVGLLRERDQLGATLQRLVMVVLGVLAPVLGAGLILFLLSLPFTGLGKLWDSEIPATPLMLVAGAGAILLANAVIGDGVEQRATSPVLRLSAMALVLAVLPLAIVAAVSLSQRVGQYGWTPERIWAAVAVLVALVYGAIGWFAVAKRRIHFDTALRPLQTRLAMGLCGLALLLALPILDFGAISARSQMARLASGQTRPEQFDWQAMAFDFGPAGRRRLAEIARAGPVGQRGLAAAALASDNRHDAETEVAARQSEARLGSRMRVIPHGALLSPELRLAVARTRFCRIARCLAVVADPRRVILAGAVTAMGPIETATLVPDAKGAWANESEVRSTSPRPTAATDLGVARVEVRRVARRILVIDGQPVGEAFE
jgi:hypothetical protein